MNLEMPTPISDGAPFLKPEELEKLPEPHEDGESGALLAYARVLRPVGLECMLLTVWAAVPKQGRQLKGSLFCCRGRLRYPNRLAVSAKTPRFREAVGPCRSGKDLMASEYLVARTNHVTTKFEKLGGLQ